MYNDINAQPDNDEMLVKALIKELHLNYTQFPFIWAERFQWQRRLWNNCDRTGMANRLIKDVSNMVLSDRPKIRTNSEYVNYVIEREIKQGLSFDSILSKYLTYCMGIGDMAMTVYTSPLTGRPAINYIPGNNIIPIDYDPSTGIVTRLAWFQKSKIADAIYVTCVIESKEGRTTMLYKYDLGVLQMINYGQPLWFRILGDVQPDVFYEEPEGLPYDRFALFHTGLNSNRWIDTPFHNGFIWPLKYLDDLETDWRRLDEEFEYSGKAIFCQPDMIRKTATATDENGFPIEMKKANIRTGVFQAADIGDEKALEWAPNVRGREFMDKIQFTLSSWTQAVGLGSEFYKMDYPKIEMTATQSLLSHKEAYNTINDIKINLELAIKKIIYALLQEYYKEGLIPDEEMAVILDPSSIEVDFDDSIFVNRDARTDLGIRLMNSSNTIPGMRNIDQMTLLVDYCGYSKQRAEYIIQKTKEEFEQSMMLQMMMQGTQQ